MQEQLEQAIRDKLKHASWAAMRALLADPSQEPAADEVRRIEDAMRCLAAKGEVVLWKLAYKYDSVQMMAVSRPDLDLGADLEQRGAWATAERVSVDADPGLDEEST
jgi:phosphate-selective porin